MNTDLDNMKQVFLLALSSHLEDIEIPFEARETKEIKMELNITMLSTIIVFPGAYSDLRSFAPSQKRNRFGIVANIKNKNNKNMFDIGDYLLYKKMPGKEKLTFDIREVNYTSGFNIALAYLVSLYNSPLKDILLGKVWEDIPFDWSDYK
jgi:hypothetical protein